MTSSEKSKVLGHQVLLNDVYYAAEIEEVSVTNADHRHSFGQLCFHINILFVFGSSIK